MDRSEEPKRRREVMTYMMVKNLSAVAHVALLFLLGLALRNRFRMR